MLMLRVDGIHLGKGFYILVASTLTVYIVVNEVGFSGVFSEFLKLYLLVTNVSAIIISIALLQVLGKISVEVENKTGLELVEGMEVVMKIGFKSRKILQLVKVSDIRVKSDIGLWVNRWSFDEEGYIGLYITGYPGTHRIYGYRVKISTPLSVYTANLDIDLDTAIEVRFTPTKYITRFNIDVVLPYLQILEGRSSKRKGVGAEVMSVREFAPGDEYKKIHWKATARTGKLMVKEHEHRVYRNAVVIVAVHKEFFIGAPPPLLYLVKLVIDVVESIVSKGMRVVLGIITERDIKISTIIDRTRLHEAYRVLSEIEWPTNMYKYTSSNRILRWFTNATVKNYCREQCVTFLVVDPLDSMDVDSIVNIYRILNQQKHVVKVLLTTPSSIRFLYTARVGIEDIDMVQKEVARLRRILSIFRIGDVYLPTAYLRY